MHVAALSIAGSDSGGGAGIQMDLRVFQRLGVFGTTAITAVTAQNLEGVTAVVGQDPELVRAQIEATLGGFPVSAIKTGMLWSADIVQTVATALSDVEVPIVVDPVMVATSGARLLQEDAIAAHDAMWGRARLVTPNLDEAEVLLGRPVRRDALKDEARALQQRLRCAVLLKGGHLEGAPIDTLATRTQLVQWRHARIEGANTHGSGCLLSSAIAAHLARGETIREACAHGLAFVHDALARGAERRAAGLADVEHAMAHAEHLVEIAP